MNAGVLACAAQALELLRHEAYYADRVDWVAVEREVMRRAGAGRLLTQALEPAFAALGDQHSHVVPAAAWRTRQARRRSDALPHGAVLGNGVGYLRLPAVSALAGAAHSFEYRRATCAILNRRPQIRAWIVDLRGNTGGTIYPMLAGVAPLLGSQVFLAYRRREGWGARFSYRCGRLLNNGRPVVELPDVPGDRGDGDPPVAVLHDERTASAGEGVVVAFRGRGRTSTFGRATAGVPTGNMAYALADGSLLAVTVSVAVDRLGRCYAGSIPPQEPGRDSTDTS